jgi:hypothetical protein
MDTYLEVEVQDELCRRLFLSFVKRTPSVKSTTTTMTPGSIDGKAIKVLLMNPLSFLLLAVTVM